jgi:hypothetical protein
LSPRTSPLLNLPKKISPTSSMPSSATVGVCTLLQKRTSYTNLNSKNSAKNGSRHRPP